MELVFSGGELTPDLLRCLAGDTRLERLTMRGGVLPAGSLELLSSLTRLKALAIMEMRVDDSIFGALRPLHRLESLHLPYTSVRGDFSPLAGLGLRELRLEGCRLVGDACAATLAGFPSLRHLELHMTGVTDTGVAALAGLPLEVLWLGPRVTDDSLASLARILTLRHLDLCAHMVTDAGMTALAALPNLHTLWVTRCSVTDDSVPVLAAMHALRELNVSHTGVSAAGLERLRAALPACRLIEPD